MAPALWPVVLVVLVVLHRVVVNVVDELHHTRAVVSNWTET